MKLDPKSRNGSKYTVQKSKLVLELLMQGESIKYSAQAADVTPVTLYRWSKKYKKFGKSFKRIQRVRERHRVVFHRIALRKTRSQSSRNGRFNGD